MSSRSHGLGVFSRKREFVLGALPDAAEQRTLSMHAMRTAESWSMGSLGRACASANRREPSNKEHHGWVTAQYASSLKE